MDTPDCRFTCLVAVIIEPTLLSLFREAVYTYGFPSCVRIDQGGENVDVSMFLLTHPMRMPGRSLVIVGKSVHNQRIENLWRDVYQGVLGFYHGLFKHLEVVSALDPNDEIHLFVFTSSTFLESTVGETPHMNRT